MFIKPVSEKSGLFYCSTAWYSKGPYFSCSCCTIALTLIQRMLEPKNLMNVVIWIGAARVWNLL